MHMKKVIALVAVFILLNGLSHAENERKKPGSYAELVSWYENLEKEYPGYMELFKANEYYGLGKVDGGYDLYYVRVTNESRGFLKPEVLFLGSPHGDETVGTIGLYWTVKWLMEQRTSGNEWAEWLLNNREIYIEVSHNPYGFDHIQRWDANDWDLNREADYDWTGQHSELWGSVNGQTLYHFINDHAIRVASDFHGGARMILYPWSSTHADVKAKSPFSEKEYTYAPPDFYFYHVASLRLGEYMGTYGGALNEHNIGTIPTTVGYRAPGCLTAWGYGANVNNSPAEDEFVDDEVFGNYEGCGIFWVTPEMSTTKDPPEWQFGDEERGYIAEVLRFVIHQTDLAQPSIRWAYPENNSFSGNDVVVGWQVYGSLVVDETYLQYSFSPDFSDAVTGPIHDEYRGSYRGGTYWDGITWEEPLTIPEGVTDVYLRAYAKVDGAYAQIISPDVYGPTSYLRIVKERTDDTYLEVMNTSDGTEYVRGNLIWESPLMHIKIGGISTPKEGYLYLMGKEIAPLPGEKTIIIGGMNVEVQGAYDRVAFYVDDGLRYEDTDAPYRWQISNVVGMHTITARMYYGGEVQDDYLDAFLLVIK